MSNNRNQLNRFFRGKVRVSACTVNQWAMDFDGNYIRIKKAIENAIESESKVILLPELVTTGYSCQDHFNEREIYTISMNIIKKIVLDKFLSKNRLLVLGAPVIHGGVKYNTMIFIANNEIILIRPKINLADDGNYREARWFTTWSKNQIEIFDLPDFPQKSVPIGIAIINCNGVNIAAEVCEELWVPDSMNIPLYLSNTDIILNSSGSHFEMNKINKRKDLINAATRRSGGAYVYSNCEGCDGDRLYFDGGSMIGLNGKILAVEERFNIKEFKHISVDINLDDITSYRLKGSSIQTQSGRVKEIPLINIKLDLISKESSNKNNNINNRQTRELYRTTFGNDNKNKEQSGDILVNCLLEFRKNLDKNKNNSNEIIREKIKNISLIDIDKFNIKDITDNEIIEITEASACWLWDYLRRSGANGFMLPLSGGADSAAVATIVFTMCKIIASNLENLQSDSYPKTPVVKTILESNINANINPNIYNNARLIFGIILRSVYLPNEGKSGGITLERSKNLAESYGGLWDNVPISSLYNGAKGLINEKGIESLIKLNIEKESVFVKFKQNINANYTKKQTELRSKISNQNILQAKIKELEKLNEDVFKDLSKINNEQSVENQLLNLNPSGTIYKIIKFQRAIDQWSQFGIADENIQARLRMVVTYLLSQVLCVGGFLLNLGCSNADEILIGYYTKYDASSADINPIGSLPKRYINKILQYYSTQYGGINNLEHLIQNPVFSVLVATPTAELKNVNSTGAQTQTDEGDFGMTYEQIYYLGKLRASGLGMVDTFNKACKLKVFELDGKKNIQNVFKIVTNFFDRYRKNRNKAVIVTPSVHLLPSPDDNRFDLRPFLYPDFIRQKAIISEIIEKKISMNNKLIIKNRNSKKISNENGKENRKGNHKGNHKD